MIAKRSLKFAALAVAAVLAAWLGTQLVRSRAVTVEVARSERNVPIRVFGLGTVEARIKSKIGFEVGAALVELHADHGDRVEKGKVLARLNSGEQQARVAKAHALVQIAQVNIRRAEANLAKARAVLAQKQEANKRKKALAGRDVVSQQSAEEAERDEAVAQADVIVADSEITSAKAQLADAEAQQRFESTLLDHRTLKAPYDAVIIERHVETGTVVKPGDPIFTLVAADSYWGLAYVDEARAGFLSEGQLVDARLRSRPQDKFTGKVIRIGLESDRATEERRVYVRGDNPPSRVYLGEQVEFLITVATLDEALLVPEAAVDGFDGREARVWVVDQGRLARRKVAIRHRTEDARLEIVDTLPKDVHVVTQPLAGLKEGRAAKIREARSK